MPRISNTAFNRTELDPTWKPQPFQSIDFHNPGGFYKSCQKRGTIGLSSQMIREMARLANYPQWYTSDTYILEVSKGWLDLRRTQLERIHVGYDKLTQIHMAGDTIDLRRAVSCDFPNIKSYCVYPQTLQLLPFIREAVFCTRWKLLQKSSTNQIQRVRLIYLQCNLTTKAQKEKKEKKTQKRRKIVRNRWLGSLLGDSDREIAPVNSQQCSCLNKISRITTCIDMPAWKGEISHGPTSRGTAKATRWETVSSGASSR